ncbi:MAG: uroporphyrinogen decarboxylase family protein [Kiritimatiellae bacterium]|nr:uroporphyrinogen decarboxylase family protein [Kiritimatiellia bacterium]
MNTTAKPKSRLTPRERVLAALRRTVPDRVPWMEGIVGNGIASVVCGEPIRVDWSVAPDGFPRQRGAELAEEQKKVNRVFGKDNINFSAFAPVFASKMEKASDGSPVMVGDGLIRSRDDFECLFKLPPPDDAGFIANAREFVAHKEDYCAVACVRLGIGATLLSMGIEAFAYGMSDDPQLIGCIHDAYADWTARVVPIMEDIGFDVIWGFDDVAFNNGPIFAPEFYRKHILPKERHVVRSFTRPFISHSDGNMGPLLDAWLELGQAAIHPIQPDVMDIGQIKRLYGGRVCLVGNIFMTDLVSGSPDDIDRQVRERIEAVGKGGGYILSSSNSLTDDMHPANIRSMIHALDRYGWYA